MLTNMTTSSVPIWDARGFLKEANLFGSKKTVFSVDKVEEVCTLFQGELRSSDIIGVIHGFSSSFFYLIVFLYDDTTFVHFYSLCSLQYLCLLQSLCLYDCYTMLRNINVMLLHF